MNTITRQKTNNTDSLENEHLLQVKRSLIPLARYTEQKGTSESDITKRAKLGIIQLRKFQGKTFVVDTPHSPYRIAADQQNEDTASHYTPAPTELAKETDLQQQQESKLEQQVEKRNILFNRLVGWCKKIFKRNNGTETLSIELAINENENTEQLTTQDKPQALEKTDKQIEKDFSETIQGNAFLKNRPEEQLQPQFKDQEKQEDIFEELALEPPSPITVTKELTQEELKELSKMETYSEPIRIPDLETTDEMEDTIDIDEELTPKKSSCASTTTSSKTALFWKVAAGSSIILFIAALFTNIWFYKNAQLRQNKLDQAYASIQTIYNDFIHKKQQTETAQAELENTKAKLREAQNELEQSNAKENLAKEELAQTKQSLKTIQNQNSAGLKKLNEQIKQLTESFNKALGK